MSRFKISKKSISIIAGVLLILLLAFAFLKSSPSANAINMARLNELLQSQNALKISLRDNVILIKDTKNLYEIPATAKVLDEILSSYPVSIDTSPKTSEIVSDLVFYIFIFVLLAFVFVVLGRQKKILSQSSLSHDEAQPQASYTTITHSKVKFSDVAGIDEVKSELEEIVDFLKEPNKFKSFGVSLPRGVLLIGPPGVGKTMVAKAVAGEAGVPFFYQNGSSFVEMYVGVGARRVRQLFSRARALAPSIVFIDEIDAIGRARGAAGANEEREATLNQLLTEMDGFEDSSGVIVIAATNKIEMIDAALLRSGRFDRRIHLSMPSLADRSAILQSYLKNKPHAISDVQEIARLSVGFSGAALATLVNEAGLHALRRKASLIELDDFLGVINKVIDGKKKVLSYTKAEQEVLGQYQAAKAYAAYWLDVSFERISLVQDRFSELSAELYSRTQLLARIKVMLAGNEWLRLSQNETYSNAKNDLNQASVLARQMHQSYAMAGSESELLGIASKECLELVRSGAGEISKIAAYLMQNESIDMAGVRKILKGE